MNNLHASYCTLTGFNIAMTIWRERCWFEWVKAGFTQADLELVLRYLKAQIARGNRRPACLKFSNLIEQTDRFEEDLAMARGWSRKPVPTARDTFLASTGRAAPPPVAGAKPISEILPQVWQQGVEQMRKAADGI